MPAALIEITLFQLCLINRSQVFKIPSQSLDKISPGLQQQPFD